MSFLEWFGLFVSLILANFAAEWLKDWLKRIPEWLKR